MLLNTTLTTLKLWCLCFVLNGCLTLSISVSSVRWPQTFTTCLTAMDTSWTAAVLSRWRGRARWPLTSSPVALRAGSVRGGDNHRVTPTGLARTAEIPSGGWAVSHCTKRKQMTASADKQCLSPCCQVATCTHVEFVHVQPPHPHPLPLLERSQSPVALDRFFFNACMNY